MSSGQKIDEGGQFYGAMDFFNSQGFSSENGQQFTNRVMAEAFFEATRTCEGSGFAGEIVDLNCSAPVLDGRTFTQNESCQTCLSLREAVLQGRDQLEQEAVTLSGGRYMAQTLPESTKNSFLSNNPGINPCRYMCDECIIENQRQITHLHMTTSCTFDDRFQLAMQNSLSDAIEREVISKTKALQAVSAGSLSPKNISFSMSNTLFAQFQEKISDTIFSAVRVYQNITFLPGSFSIVASDNLQVFSGSVVLSFIQRTFANVNIYNRDDVSQVIASLSKNSSGLDALRKDAKAAIHSLKDLFRNNEGRLAVIAALILFVVLTGALAMFFLIKKTPQQTLR